MYVSPEFQLGQVYDGTGDMGADDHDVVLYRPVYCCVPHDKVTVTNTNNAKSKSSNSSRKASSSSSQERLMLNDTTAATEEEAGATEKMTSV